MKVVLEQAWFAPNATRYAAGEHEFPDDWKDLLPPKTEVLEEAPKPKPTAKLKDM